MIDLDELKMTWVELDRKLDVNIHLNRQLLNATKLNQSRSSLKRLTVYASFEVALWVVIIVALGDFIYEHIAVAHFSVPAVALDLYSIGMLNSLIRQTALAQQIDYGKPITVIQKQVEALRVLRIRTVQWGFLAGLVAWVPFLIVVFKAFFGVDIYEAAWVWSNVGFGLALIPLAIRISKKFSDRMGRSPIIQGLTRSLSGYNLNAAADSLNALSEFEAEEC